jgi:hypothetical protein
MKTTERTTEQEIAALILGALNGGRLDGMEISEIHHEVFNTDYFIIGRYAAEQWLIANGGVFNAIGRIQEYETDNFGEVSTDLSEPERVCNMYVYILGEEVLQELYTITDNWDEQLTDELKEQLRDELTEYLS